MTQFYFISSNAQVLNYQLAKDFNVISLSVGVILYTQAHLLPMSLVVSVKGCPGF